MLRLRGRPAQSRSAATFQLVLDTTARLLEAHGFDALTTNLVAQESGVSVRAIYRYFPNKHAIVAELAQQMSEEWRGAVAERGDFADRSVPWATLWDGYIDAFVDAVRATRGARAVLAAMREDPLLRRVDEIANTRYVDGIATALITRRPTLRADEARAAATVLMRSMVSVLDEAFESDERSARRLIAMLKRMHVGLLRELLRESADDPVPRSRPTISRRGSP